MLVPFAEWRPDVELLNSAYTGDVANVLCADGSYIPFRAFSPLTVALPSGALGGFMSRDTAGAIRIFAGTAEALYLYNNGTLAWDDVSQAATTYAAGVDARWSFAQFGNYVIAVNQNDDPQVYELGVSSAFADLGGSPPRAGIVKVWGDFVALMNLTSNPNRVQWSGLNNAAFWTPGSNNSDYQDFPDGGVVQSSTEATNPLIFLERAIYRGTFIPGSVEIFSFQKIHDLRGAKARYSVASRGAIAFYADEGGFFQIGADGSLVPVGYEKVDRTIFGAMQASDIANIFGAIDPFHSRVYWAVDYAGLGAFDTLLIYDWTLGRWSKADIAATMIFPAATAGYTLDTLDSISASLDSLPYSLDSKVWQGGSPVLAAFGTDDRLGFFSGDFAEATVTTQEIGDPAGAVVRTTSIYPVTDADTTYVSIGFRFRRGMSEAVNWLSEQVPSANTGRVRRLSRARFHRFKVRIAADAIWSHASGVDVETSPAGQR